MSYLCLNEIDQTNIRLFSPQSFLLNRLPFAGLVLDIKGNVFPYKSADVMKLRYSLSKASKRMEMVN